MADTITSNYHWVKPEISGSPTTWGNKLNADLDQIDNTVFSNDAAQTAAIAAAIAANILIGEIKMFAGFSGRRRLHWLRCDGTVYANLDILGFSRRSSTTPSAACQAYRTPCLTCGAFSHAGFPAKPP